MSHATYIAAVTHSINHVSQTMLDLPIRIGQPALRKEVSGTFDASAIIGLSGDCVGTVAMSYPAATAKAMVSRFIGSDVDEHDASFADALGELANMVTGAAKAKFEGMSVSISCPSVIVGAGHQVFQQRDMPVIEIPCDSDAGAFTVQVSIREQTSASGATAGVTQAAEAG